MQQKSKIMNKMDNNEIYIEVKCELCDREAKFRSIKEAYFDGWDISNWRQGDKLCKCPKCSGTSWAKH
jgi:hypothetical protein